MLPLGAKFALVTSVLVLALLLLTGVLSLWRAYDGAQIASLTVQERKADALATRINDYISGVESQLAWTAQPEWTTAGNERQTSDLTRVLRQFPAVTEIAFIDREGLEQLKISRRAPDSIGSRINRAADDRFAQTARARTWFGPVYVVNGVDLSGTVAVGHPDGAVTAAEIDLSFLSRYLKAVSDEVTQALVVNSEGRLIAHPERNAASGDSDLSALPHVETALAVGGSGTFANAAVDGIPMLAAYAQIPRLGWTVFVQTPKSEALSPFRSQLWQFVLLLLASLVVAALVGRKLAQSVTAPVDQLRTAASQLAEGDMSRRVSVRSRDEIGALADRFNVMASRLQQAFRGLEAKADERAHGLDLALQQQMLTAGVLKAIGQSTQSLETVLETLVTSAVEICEASHGAVWLMDGKHLKLAAQAGYNDEWQEAAQTAALTIAPDAKTPHGLAAYVGQPISADDLPGDQRFANGPRPGYAGDRAGIAVPIQRDGTVEGVIWLSHEASAPFTERQAGLVLGFADQALIAVENTRLAENVDDRDRILSDMRTEQTAVAEIARVASHSPADAKPVLDAVVASAAQLLGGDCAYLFLFDGSLLQLRSHYGLSERAQERLETLPGDAEGAAARAFASGAAVEIPTLDDNANSTGALSDAKSIVAVPLRRDGSPAGVLVVERKQAGNVPERHIELLTAFGNKVLSALASARFSADLDTRDGELSAALARQDFVDSLVREIAAPNFDIVFVAGAIGRHIARQCAANAVDVFRREGEAYLSLSGPSQVHAGADSLVGRVALSAEKVLIDDAAEDAELAEKDASLRSMLGIPLKSGDRLIGVVQLSRQQADPFTDEDLAASAAFVELAAIAVEKANLLEEARRRTAEIADALVKKTASSAMLRIVGRTAARPQDTLPDLATVAGDICGASKVQIVSLEEDHPPLVDRGLSDAEWKAGGCSIEELRDIVFSHHRSEGNVLRIDDLASFSGQEKTVLSPEGRGAVLAVPMWWEGAPVGIFILLRNDAVPFSDTEAELVESLADHATIAIVRSDLQDRLDATGAELKNILSHRQASETVSRLMDGSARTPQPVFDAIAGELARACEADGAALVFLGEDEPHMLAVSGTIEAEICNHFATVLGQGADIVHIASLADDEDLSEVASGAVLAIPLMRDAHTGGMLLLRRSSAGAFSSREIELAETLGRQAAAAVQGAKLFTDLAGRNRELSQALERQRALASLARTLGEADGHVGEEFDRLLTSMSATVRELAKADTVGLYLCEDDEYGLAAQVGMDTAMREFEQAQSYAATRDTLVGRTAFERAIVHLPDMSLEDAPEDERDDTRAALCIPLLRNGRIEGVLVLTRSQTGAFDTDCIEVLRTFAEHVGTAIGSRDLAASKNTLTALLDNARVQWQLAAGHTRTIGGAAYDLASLLQSMAATAARFCDAATARFYLLDGEAYPLAAAHGITPDQREFEAVSPPVEHKQAWVGRAALEKGLLHLTDLADVYSPETQRFGDVGSILCVPLLRLKKTMGVLAVARPDPASFTPAQIELVKTLADQAMIAIDNIRLLDETHRQSDELAILSEDLSSARARLSETEGLTALGQFTAGILHEIREPLESVDEVATQSSKIVGDIRKALELAVIDVDTRAEIEDLSYVLSDGIDTIGKNGQRANALIQHMLDHARDGAGEHRFVDINTMVDESLGLAYHGARAERQHFNVTLRKSLDPEAGSVDLYPQQLTRVLLNLISNGFDATERRSAGANGNGYEPVLATSTRNLGNAVEIRIRDNGTGISDEVREKMFEPFFTTKSVGQGTGLGLSQTRDIVVNHHAGSIEVESEPGSYTEFRIVLPREGASLAHRSDDGQHTNEAGTYGNSK